MRIFSYILTALVTIFVINIALSFSLPAYRNALVNVRTNIFPIIKKAPDNQIAEEKKSESARLAESLDRIDKHIESLSETKSVGSGSVAMSGTVDVGSGAIGSISGTTAPEEENVPKEPDIPLSWLFLAKIMPEVTVKKIENSWFFGIQVMGKIVYNTYFDEKKKIKIYAFSDTYDNILLNMKLASSVYALNETDQFFWYTFFLNPAKKDPKDTTVRFVTALEGRAIGVEVPKNYYSSLKKMLLKNK